MRTPIRISIAILLALVANSSISFAYPTDDYAPGKTAKAVATLPESPTYESLMEEYSVDDEITGAGPSRLLGRLYGALTASGKTEDRLTRLEIALRYDRVLFGRVRLAEHEAGAFEGAMPEVGTYEKLRSRFDTEKKALEGFPFVRNFKHDFDISLMTKKLAPRVFGYFARERAPGDAEKAISKMEFRLRKNPPKSDKALLQLFLEKELMREYLEMEKQMQREGKVSDMPEGE